MSERRRHKNHYMKASPSSGEGFWKKAGILADHIRSKGEITVTEMREAGVRNWSEVHTGKFNEEMRVQGRTVRLRAKDTGRYTRTFILKDDDGAPIENPKPRRKLY